MTKMFIKLTNFSVIYRISKNIFNVIALKFEKFQSH